MEILKGLPVANAINEKLIEEVKDLKGPLPRLAIIREWEKDLMTVLTREEQ